MIATLQKIGLQAHTGSSAGVTWFDSSTDIPQDLWDRCFPPPLEGQWWYRALEQSNLESQFRFLYGLISVDDGSSALRPSSAAKHIGIVTAFLMNVPLEVIAPAEIVARLRSVKPLSRFLYQRTLFIGSPCAEEGTIGLVPGFSLRDIAPRLQQAFDLKAREAGASMLVWKDFSEESTGALDVLSRTAGLFKTVSFPGTMVNLTPGDFDDYLKGLKRSHRQKLNRKLRLSKAECPVNVRVIRNPTAL